MLCCLVFMMKNAGKTAKVLSASADTKNRENHTNTREGGMPVDGVDRADAAAARQNAQAEAARAENDRRREEAQSARQERQAPRETNRGGNVDVTG